MAVPITDVKITFKCSGYHLPNYKKVTTQRIPVTNVWFTYAL